MTNTPTPTPTPYNPSAIPDSWHNLGWYFDGILIHDLGNKKTNAFSSYDSAKHSREDAEAMLDAYEEAWLAEAESAVSLLSLSGDIDMTGFSRDSISIVVRRAEVIAAFIYSLHVDEVSVFGLPSRCYKDCIHWLMIDWWSTHGKTMAVDIFLSEYLD